MGEPEEWRTIPWFGDIVYQVSNYGNVRRMTDKGPKPRAVSIHARAGYPKVTLNYPKSSKGKSFFVHALVLEAFSGPRPMGAVACHGDGSRTNNWIGNLRWGTPKENAADMKLHGTQQCGSANSRAKIDENAVREIRAAYAQRTVGRPWGAMNLARKFGIHHNHVTKIARHHKWAHLSGEDA